MMGHRLLSAAGSRVKRYPNTWTTASTTYPTNIRYSNLFKLADGRVLNVGGSSNTTSSGVTSLARFGTISGDSVTWASGTNLPASKANAGGVLLPDGRILIIGGGNTSGNPVSTSHFGTISGNTITWAAATAFPVAAQFLTAALLADGRVVVVGGDSNVVRIGTISGNTITWVTSTALPTSPALTARLPMYVRRDGKIVVAGLSGGTYIGTVSGDSITWESGTEVGAAALVYVVSPRRNALWVPDNIGNGRRWVPTAAHTGANFWGQGVELDDGRFMTIGGTNDFVTISNAINFGS